MFTGIVEDLGKIEAITKKGKDVIFVISANKINVDELEHGESISVNGTCLTVISLGKRAFEVKASHETLNRTNLSRLRVGSRVNLERALRVGDRLGGHIVNGHVDGIGRIISIEKKGESKEIWVTLIPELSRYVVEKGSIAIDGVSLTVNRVDGDKFSVNIIPYTQDVTIFGDMITGDLVNIECDIIGKYVEKFVLEKKEKKDLRGLVRKL
ncbi:MAG: riboflavin synthase [Thermodesulfobacteriota bacterium]